MILKRILEHFRQRLKPFLQISRSCDLFLKDIGQKILLLAIHSGRSSGGIYFPLTLIHIYMDEMKPKRRKKQRNRRDRR